MQAYHKLPRAVYLESVIYTFNDFIRVQHIFRCVICPLNNIYFFEKKSV